MIDLDGTSDKLRLGANVIYSVSIAVARAAANSRRIPLYRYLDGEGIHLLPVPMFNMINGRRSLDTQIESQEFLLIPAAAESYSEAQRMGVEIFYHLENTIIKNYGHKSLHIGSSAGYAAPDDEPSKILDTLLGATEEAGYG